MGQSDAMEVGHFKPKHRPEFAHLEHEWTNLYYCCRRCNQHELNHWPTDEEARRGLRSVDPYAEDPDDHFRLCRHPQRGDRWLDHLGVVGWAQRIEATFLTGTAITILIALMLLVMPGSAPHHQSHRRFSHCRVCHNPVDPHARYCGRCGSRVRSQRRRTR